MTQARLLPHPLAEIFPLIQGEDFNDFVADIKTNGQREDIWLYEGKILDGRNRYTACLMGQREPRTEDYEGDDPLGFVLSLNLHRRHLTASQRAMVAVKLSTMRQGQRTDLPPPGGRDGKVDQIQAATALRVSPRLVSRASVVHKKGDEALIKKVEIGHMTVELASKIALHPKAIQTQILESKDALVELRAVTRRAKFEKMEMKAAALPERTYLVIEIDCPWPHETWSEKGKEKSQENHYPTMTLAELAALKIPAADSAVVFAWTTVPHLMNAGRLMEDWGFEYKSHYVWNKDRVGTGYWNRNKHEILLIGTRGGFPAPPREALYASVVDAPVGRHSEKPPAFREMIATYYPMASKLIMFHRGAAPNGWDAWGNEVTVRGEGAK